MSVFSAGLSGLMKTLVDRLTATRAANLDNLDVATSTRAPSSTALSTSAWPDTRADLVALIAQVSGGLSPAPSALVRSPYLPGDCDTDPDIYDQMRQCWGTWMTTLSGTGSGAYEPVVSVGPSQAGSLSLCLFAVQGAGNVDVDMRVTMDGVVVHSGAHPTQSNVRDNSFTVCGMANFDKVTGTFLGFQLETVRFKSDMLIEVRRNDDTTSVRTMYLHRLAL